MGAKEGGVFFRLRGGVVARSFCAPDCFCFVMGEGERGEKRGSEERRSQEAGGAPPEGGAQQSCQVISRCDGFIDVGGASKSPRSNWVDNPIFRFRPPARNLAFIIQAVTSSYIHI